MFCLYADKMRAMIFSLLIISRMVAFGYFLWVKFG